MGRKLTIVVGILLLLAACSGGSQECWTPLEPLADDEYLFHLWFNNQSDNEEPIDLTLRIDGQEAACFVFESHSQLDRVRFDFGLASGLHELRVSSGDDEIVQSIDVDSELWGVVDVAANPVDGSTSLGLATQGEPTIYDATP